MLPKLPSELDTDIKALPGASNRLLVRGLFLALVIVFGLWLNSMRGNNNNKDAEIRDCQQEKKLKAHTIDSLINELTKRDRLDNERLKGTVQWQDSLIKSLQTSKITKP